MKKLLLAILTFTVSHAYAGTIVANSGGSGTIIFNAGGGGGSGVSGSSVTVGPTITVALTTATIGSNCSVSFPCNFRFNKTVYPITSSATAIVSAGTGTAYIYVDANGVLNVGHNVTLTCAGGCTATGGITAYPESTIPIGRITATAGVWNSSGITDDRSPESYENIVSGSGLSTANNGITRTLSADTSIVTQKFTGAGTPGNITASTLGDVYLSTNTATLYTCNAVGGGCNGVSAGQWVASGGGSGTPGGSPFNVQFNSAGAFTGAAGFNVNPSSVAIDTTYGVYMSSHVAIGGPSLPLGTLDIEKTGGAGGTTYPRIFLNPNTTGGTNAFLGATISGGTGIFCIGAQDTAVPTGLNDGSTNCSLELTPTLVRVGNNYGFVLNNVLTLGHDIGNPTTPYWITWTRSSDSWESGRFGPQVPTGNPGGSYDAGLVWWTNNGASASDITAKMALSYDGRLMINNNVGSYGWQPQFPSSRLSSIGLSTDKYTFSVGQTTSTFSVAFSTSGHNISSGTAPSISSCGTTPNGSAVGDDNQGTITIGGGVVTACTVTFANTWGTAPTCTISDNSTAVTGDISSLSATAMTLGFSASLGGGTVYYRCGCSGASCL